MEIGPDDEMPTPNEAAKLLQMLEGEDVAGAFGKQYCSERLLRKGVTMEINREYRSSVFAMLFNDRKELLTLYNAINGTAYTEEDRVISELPFYGSSQTVDKVGVKLLVSHPLFLFSHNFIMRP